MEKRAEIVPQHRAMGTEGRGDREKRRQGDNKTYHIVLFPCLYAILPFLLPFFFFSFLSALTPLTCQSYASEILAQERSKGTSTISAKAKVSFGYDNNVSERKEDRLESRFYQFYISSGMCMSPAERTLLSLKLQDGLKYLDAPSLSGESVLINRLSLGLSHQLSERLTPEIQSEIRGRTSIHSESGVLPSEEAYLRGSAGAGLRAMLLSDVMGRIFYQYNFTNFEDFDPFDRKGPQMGLRVDVKLLPESTITFQYSREKTRFNKWDLVSSEEKTSRVDVVNGLSVFAQLYKYFLFDITYSYQNSKSDAYRYSYKENKFALLMAKSLSSELMLHLHALVRYRKYQSTPDETVPIQIDLEDDERGLLTVKLSRDINEACVLEAQYDLRRSTAVEEDGLYTKGVFSFSMSFHF